MPNNPQEFASLFGAKIVGEVPDVGGGPFGMARLAHLASVRPAWIDNRRPGSGSGHWGYARDSASPVVLGGGGGYLSARRLPRGPAGEESPGANPKGAG